MTAWYFPGPVIARIWSRYVLNCFPLLYRLVVVNRLLVVLVVLVVWVILEVALDSVEAVAESQLVPVLKHHPQGHQNHHRI